MCHHVHCILYFTHHQKYTTFQTTNISELTKHGRRTSFLLCQKFFLKTFRSSDKFFILILNHTFNITHIKIRFNHIRACLESLYITYTCQLQHMNTSVGWIWCGVVSKCVEIRIYMYPIFPDSKYTLNGEKNDGDILHIQRWRRQTIVRLAFFNLRASSQINWLYCYVAG